MTQAGPRTERGALPVELTHFVGREQELAALRKLAGGARLLTLTGAGGSGKSRLALELVTQGGALERELAWVELAPLMEERLVPGAMLRALGSPTEGAIATADAIISDVGDRAVTIVLDNCEHLVDACAALADSILRACPRLRIIATSREALGVAGERAWLVPPMVLPQPDAPVDIVAASDAVRLFVIRAQDVQPAFELTASNACAVADICIRLDGIPLALELAAARVRHLSPEQILERLSDVFALLTTGARTALPRHRTLRAAIDWSYDTLPAEARLVLHRVSVFRGGFTLDLVEDVAADEQVPPDAVLDLVALLADRSMVIVRERDDTARYFLLETIRQYAQQRLEASGEAEVVRARFAQALTARIARAEPSFTTRARRAAFDRLEPDLDNIREVLAWSRGHDPQQHVRLAGLLWWFWFSTRHWVEADRWITGALALPAAAHPTPERAALLFAAGALAALRAHADQARPRLQEAAEIANAVGDAHLEAYCLNYTAMTYSSSLSPVAREYAGRAARWFRANGDEYGLRLALLLGGMAEYGAGELAKAHSMMEEAVTIARQFGHDRELAVALQTYATFLIGTSDDARVQAMVRESLEALRRDPSFLFIARAIDIFASGCAASEPHRAARAIGTATAMRSHIGAARFHHDEVVVSRLIAQLHETLGAAEYERAFSDGMRVHSSDAIDDVLGTAPVAAADVRDNPDAGAGADVDAAADAGVDVGGGVDVDVDVAVDLDVHIDADAGVDVDVGASSGAAAAADLVVHALGPFEVFVHGHRVETWPYARPKELLTFLLLHPQGTTRTEIGAALWPDASAAQIRNSFHVTMHHVRRTLGHPDWIVLTDARYRMSPDVSVWLDVTAFQQHARAALAATGGDSIAALRAAMALYRGHFLAGEAAASWRDDVQDRLRSQFCDAGVALAAALAAMGGDVGAAEAYERVVACEPLHEAAHRGLMLTLARAGRRAHALRHYDRLSTLLEELELEPERETVELYQRIRSGELVVGSDGIVA